VNGSAWALADPPVTKATADAERLGIKHEAVRRERSYSVEEAAAKLGVSVDALIKTLVVRRSEGEYVLVCLPGSRSIDWAKLRTVLEERRLSLPDAAEALAATGYERGTITPFGAEGSWPVVVDEALLDQGTVAIGGGAHGVSLLLAVGDLVSGLDARVADVGKPG
jgi:Cys-tRNA(Pro)/Cys-tRNA(Cys) deacylase